MLKYIKINQNVRNVFIYLFSTGISRSIPFLLLPLLTRLFSPTDFGILGLTVVFVSMTTPLVTFHAPGYIYAHYFKFSREELSHKLAVIVSLAVLMAILLAAVAVGLYYLGLLNQTLPLWTILSIVVIAFSMSILNIVQSLNQIEIRIKRYVVYEITNAVIIGALVVVLILMMGMKWEGRFLARFAANVIVGAAAIVYLIRSRSLSPTWDSDSLKSFLGFSAPILPHVFGLWALNAITRLFLAKFVSLEEAGFFQVAFQLAMILTLFYEAMNKVWNPFFYRHINMVDEKPWVKHKLVRFSYYYIGAVFVFAAGFLLVSQILIHVFVYEKFARSGIYLIWLVLGLGAYNATRSFIGYLFHTGKTKIIGLATALSALVNIALAFVLNNINGPVGVAQATCISFFFHATLIITFALRAYPMPWLHPFRKN